MEAIILKKLPTREWDQLVVCYTQDFGKQTYIAKSLSRPSSKQASHLDVLNLVDFGLVQKRDNLPIITSAYSLDTFSLLKQSLPALAVSSYLLEVFDKFVFDNDADEKLWQFLNTKLSLYNTLTTESATGWSKVLQETKKQTLEVLGFDHNIDLESITGNRFSSLAFAGQVIGFRT